MDNELLAHRNAELETISQEMFGEGMLLQVVEPSSLTLLKDNADFSSVKPSGSFATI